MRLHAVRAHRLEHVERRDGVLLQIALGMLGAEAHVGVGGEMKHEVGALHGARQRVGIEQVAFDEAEVRRCAEASSRKRMLAGRQVVVADDGCRRPPAGDRSDWLPMKPAAPVMK